MSTSTIQVSNFSIPSSYNDYFGVSKFEKLSQAVSNRRNKSLRNLDELSSVEDVYASIVKELTSTDPPHLNKLVKKASGILKLSQIQQPSVTTVPELESFDYDEFFFEIDNRNRTSDEFSSHLLNHQDEIISKLAKNGGEFSEIWNEFEAVTYSGYRKPPSRGSRIPESRSSLMSRSTDAKPASKRPSWKYFANHNVLSTTSATSVASLTTGLSAIAMTACLAKSGSQRKLSTAPLNKKSEYRKQVYVVKGQVVTIKDNDFCNFKNWFGDETLLKKCNGKFRKELDLSGFSNSEIRMKLQEDYKLVVEGYRPMRNGLPPLRYKSTILLPVNVSVDKLTMCRTTNGRLIIQT